METGERVAERRCRASRDGPRENHRTDQSGGGFDVPTSQGRVGKVPDPAKLGEPVASGVVPDVGLKRIADLPDDDFILFLEGWLEIPTDGVYWLG